MCICVSMCVCVCVCVWEREKLLMFNNRCLCEVLFFSALIICCMWCVFLFIFVAMLKYWLWVAVLCVFCVYRHRWVPWLTLCWGPLCEPCRQLSVRLPPKHNQRPQRQNLHRSVIRCARMRIKQCTSKPRLYVSLHLFHGKSVHLV